MRRTLAVLLLSLSATACLRYEYEHEFWLRVDGSGQVYVTGQPRLWNAFKGVGRAADPDGTVSPSAVRQLFERSGLRVRRVTLTHRNGHAYVFVAADFDDISRLPHTPAFPDLDVRLTHEGARLRLEGQWRRPGGFDRPAGDEAGLMAVRFHLPSKVYEHENAAAGVERGNIVSWRQALGPALGGRPLAFGAVIDRRSILWSTIGLFAVAGASALAVLAVIGWALVRRGRRAVSPSVSAAGR